jgi:uncharacterized protein YaiE (UPF0345 family)
MFTTNEYFEGKVKSIAFQGQDKRATVGVMAAGEYIFNTEEKEKMTIVSGQLTVKFDGQTTESAFEAGQSFEVAANSSFNVRVDVDSAYLCEYG